MLLTLTSCLRWRTVPALRVLLIFTLILFCGAASASIHAQKEVDGSIPDPMPLVTVPDDTVIFLLFGTATDNPNNPGLADTIMLVALHPNANAATLLAVPRDLYTYVPGHEMRKINTTYFYGETEGVEGGGVQMLRDAIRYSLGLEVDYYAHVDFTGFLSIIDTLGGIDIAVDCTIRDWKLKSRALNKLVPENYEMFTLPVGIHHIDADVALWYVRSRKTSTDIDRGRRQQDVLRAIWRTVRTRNLLTDLPALWDQAAPYIDTDLTLPDLIGLLPVANAIEGNRLTSLRFKIGEHVQNAWSPAPERAAILNPDRDKVQALIQQFVTPPTANQIARAGLTVQVVNTSGVEDLEWVAVDRLAQEGFIPEVIQENSHYRNYTSIYDYTGVSKGSPLPDLQRVLRVTDDGVVLEPQADRAADYKIYLGNSYLYWSCTRDVIQPRITLDDQGNVIVDEDPS